MNDRQRLGVLGETLALAYLETRGMVLIERRWRRREGEIDLVLSEGESLIFVEVRARRGRRHGPPEESLRGAKQRRLVALATRYLWERALPETQRWRIDVVALELDAGDRLISLRHLPHAVEEI